MKNKKAQVDYGFWLTIITLLCVVVALIIGFLFIITNKIEIQTAAENLCEDNDLEYLFEAEGFAAPKYFCVGYKDGEVVKYQVIKVGERYKLYKGKK